MKIAAYLIKTLKENNVTDIFGMPGGVLFDLIKELEKTEGINAHLCYNEQGAAFEACGYAQSSHSLGVAYATRGPGFTNMLTGIVDAYADSLPVLFITAHGARDINSLKRFGSTQEIDAVGMVSNVIKYAETIEDVSETWKIKYAIEGALRGRKGPVLLDFSSTVWNKEVTLSDSNENSHKYSYVDSCETEGAIDHYISRMMSAKSPLILLGDGIWQAGAKEKCVQFVNKLNVPVISSRSAIDIGACCNNYCGYIGSHGSRAANFVFAKADYVLTLGNRLDFPRKSESYTRALRNKVITRLDIDTAELSDQVLNATGFNTDLNAFFNQLNKRENVEFKIDQAWIDYCENVKNFLSAYDLCESVSRIESVIESVDNSSVIVGDVGNNEFWLSQAYVHSKRKNRILFSKAFAALGNAIPKAIGCYFATKKPVICFTGDQGAQINIQELELIGKYKLPILICIINNQSSGMIRDHSKKKFGHEIIHTLNNNGYGSPNFEYIARAYDIGYINCEDRVLSITGPHILELCVENDVELIPNLSKGADIQALSPKINDDLYSQLNNVNF